MLRAAMVALLGLCALWLSPASAEAGSVVIGGKRLTCSSARIEHTTGLNDAGYAKPGLILLNPRILSRFPPETQKLIFLHECGHQHVGFDNSEAAADCWAVRRGREQGWLDDRAMERICQSVSTWAGSSVHLPGPARCQAMRRCFEQAASGKR